MKKYFDGKKTVITGAGSGIGRAIAYRLAEMGCHIAICDIDKIGLEETSKNINLINSQIKLITSSFDIREQASYEAFRDLVVSEFKTIDLLFNNAGFTIVDRADSSAIDDMKKVMDVNYWGVVTGTSLFMPFLSKDSKSHVVNLSSIYGVVSFPTQSAYCASKHAIRSYTECLAMENRKNRNLAFHSVHPGGVATNIVQNAKILDCSSIYKSEEALVDSINNVLWLSPEETANMIFKGMVKGRLHIYPGIMARYFAFLHRIFPSKYVKIFELWFWFEDKLSALKKPKPSDHVVVGSATR